MQREKEARWKAEQAVEMRRAKAKSQAKSASVAGQPAAKAAGKSAPNTRVAAVASSGEGGHNGVSQVSGSASHMSAASFTQKV
jgi:hypothetical protein